MANFFSSFTKAIKTFDNLTKNLETTLDKAPAAIENGLKKAENIAAKAETVVSKFQKDSTSRAKGDQNE